jgi:hypothetical protein
VGRRGIDELIGSGRTLKNWDVQEVTPRLQVGTPVVCHGIKCRREWKWDEMCVE